MSLSSSQPLRIGVVGATGMVGQVFMKILEERKFPLAELRPFASDNSLGKKISLADKLWDIQTLSPKCFEGLDIVFFSSGDDISKEWAPLAAKSGAYAIDNSAAFRMDANTPLIVPEVNGEILKSKATKPIVIANPNCSTIQLVVALKPLQDQFGINEVRVSSYQAVSGAGQAGYDELLDQSKAFSQSFNQDTNHKASQSNEKNNKTFPHQILFNLIPQIGSFNDDGYSSEELKIINETRKILELPILKISAFTVRVPVLNSHCETVWVTLNKETQKSNLMECLKNAHGLVIQDDPKKSEYATPIAISGQDPVYVSRIHQDLNDPKTWLMWVVADNVRKGAALNGIQIAEYLMKIGLFLHS